MNSVRAGTVDASWAGERVDVALAGLTGTSARAVKGWCEEGRVLLDGKRARKGDRVRAGQSWRVEMLHVEPLPLPVVPVVLQTAHFLVVDKPAGLACHRLREDDPPSALDAVVATFPAVATAGPDPREGGLLHRLDVNTSGALAFARDPRAHEEGRDAFRSGTARKLYVALVHGELHAHGVVDAPIAHDPADPRRSVVVDGNVSHRGDPRDARTTYRVLCRSGADALVMVDAEGGRRHQVRVHMAHAGAPLWGDDLYGGPRWEHGEMPGHALHAAWLEFRAGGEVVTATVPTPHAWDAVLTRMFGAHGMDVLGDALTAPLKALV